MAGCILGVPTLLLTPILTYGVCQSTIHVKYVIYDIFDIYDIHDIWHMTCINMSKEALSPQECSQPSYIFYKIVFMAKNCQECSEFLNKS